MVVMVVAVMARALLRLRGVVVALVALKVLGDDVADGGQGNCGGDTDDGGNCACDGGCYAGDGCGGGAA
eukprot:5752340-Pleurochrysis_carterae.AAC.1